MRNYIKKTVSKDEEHLLVKGVLRSLLHIKAPHTQMTYKEVAQKQADLKDFSENDIRTCVCLLGACGMLRDFKDHQSSFTASGLSQPGDRLLTDDCVWIYPRTFLECLKMQVYAVVVFSTSILLRYFRKNSKHF